MTNYLAQAAAAEEWLRKREPCPKCESPEFCLRNQVCCPPASASAGTGREDKRPN